LLIAAASIKCEACRLMSLLICQIDGWNEALFCFWQVHIALLLEVNDKSLMSKKEDRNEFLTIYKLAMDILPIPSSAVPCEQVFPLPKKLQQPVIIGFFLSLCNPSKCSSVCFALQALISPVEPVMLMRYRSWNREQLIQRGSWLTSQHI
jgi:hypothetical protein